MRVISFFSIFYLVLLSASAYIGYKFYTNFRVLKKRPRWVLWSMILLVALQVVGHHIYRRTSLEVSPWFLWFSYLILGIFSCLLFYLALGDIVFRPLAWGFKKYRGKETDFNRRSFLGLVGVSAANVAFGVTEVARGPRVYEVTIPLKDLPPSFEGYRIVQISDLHVGPTIGRDYVEEVRKMASELRPDALVLTGDLLDGYPESIASDLKPVSEIPTNDGIFCVTGNHEYYWGYRSWRPLFLEWGFRILENESYTLFRGEDRLSFVGIPDIRAERLDGVSIDLEKATQGVLPTDKKILLAHRPHVFDRNNDYKIDLQLSGHTHGGQYFPWSLFIGAMWKYHAGLYDHNGTWIYVNRGTGHWGPPLRSGVRAELTHLTLVRA